MKLIPNTTDLSAMDCHLHSRFSPDANACGADEPQKIADTVRSRGLKGFIVTDHLDIGHWDGYIIDFDKYFKAWERVRRDNPDLTIYIGLEVGFEKKHAKQTAKLIRDLPLEYVINSVHYWDHPVPTPIGEPPFESYLDAVIDSLDAPYEFNAVGHLGFLERYIKTPMQYADYKSQLDEIIKKAIARGVRFEENTNTEVEPNQPRREFLIAYKSAGGVMPMLGSDAHVSKSIAQRFAETQCFLEEIFN